jgi:hypothetical protein
MLSSPAFLRGRSLQDDCQGDAGLFNAVR